MTQIMPLSPTIALAQDLMGRASVTPTDKGCQELMIARLEAIGFTIERMRFGAVDNFWARRGSDKPVLAFAGHTDVVPSGPVDQWHTPPFEPTIKNGFLYGRGAADMKGSLASWVVALETFIALHPDHKGSLALLITSDEEGPFVDGTTRVIDTLEARGEKMDWCIVGEPSSTTTLGDVIKNGRRGSLTALITAKGIQGHVAYPHLVINPIHKVAPALAQLVSTTWDEGNDFFPPTSFQIANINGGTGASNVVPGHVEVMCNFRYSTQLTASDLTSKVETILNEHNLDYDIQWTYNGLPFLTSSGALVDACRHAIKAVTGTDTQLSTAGGTSDGRFIAPTGAQVVELGPCNATIHQLNECVKVSDLEQLTQVYLDILTRLMTKEL
ncbi:succinyl-diaminopimelate desuccinylase [Oceanospirillaceae bacterium]|jgi:succinyl-diaminopimelate desuccinylase|uniref:succinyl-diaminopimelate desuccinylase n=2 Tax=Candidatus Njordibacter sp. Uisw_002 TaxID=3230971 RepID=UPI00236AD941|nr:succinyl-diaminopimelate desuccinylase [Oceanospirillaceae bacterium]|tara:strand:+ start:2397 stop:3551 length:1155 start_codon:yes stop_codon:yes gene_type:complete